MKTTGTEHGSRLRPSWARRKYRERRNALRADFDDLESSEPREPLRPLRVCQCDKCVSLCRNNPGWMTPGEAVKAMEAGHARRLMRDWLEPGEKLGNDERLHVLAPASLGYEGRDAPEFTFLQMFFGFAKKGQCNFLDNDRCGLHESGFKPKQCRESLGCQKKTGPDNYEMARHWNTEEGKAALRMWDEIIRGSA